MDKITEALKKLLPETEVSEVSTAVNEMLAEVKADLESEYSAKLEEAYAEVTNELTKAEKIAEQGYQEAYEIIGELRNRLELQGEEYKAAMEESYDQMYKLVKNEQEKNAKLEVELYEEYDKKLADMRNYIVDKVDQFLEVKAGEFYEAAKRETLSDPRIAEEKCVLGKIMDIAADYMSEEEFGAVNSHKLDEARKENEQLKGQLKIMEARSIRLSTENTKLNEAYRQSQELLTEHKQTTKQDKKAEVINEQNARVEKSKQVQGRGQIAPQEKVEVIAENNSDADVFYELQVLAGLKPVK